MGKKRPREEISSNEEADKETRREARRATRVEKETRKKGKVAAKAARHAAKERTREEKIKRKAEKARKREEKEAKKGEKKRKKKDGKKKKRPKREIEESDEDENPAIEVMVPAEAELDTNYEYRSESDDENEDAVDPSTTPFVETNLRLEVSLLPSSGVCDDRTVLLDNIRRNVYHGTLLKWNDAAGGVILGYTDVRVSTGDSGDVPSAGVVHNEFPHVHYDVDARAVVFRPDPGAVPRGAPDAPFPLLQGSVTKCSASHIGLLSYGMFNASISSDMLVKSGFQWTDGVWEEYEGEKKISQNSVIEFKLSLLHECAGHISMEGCEVTVISE
mmetsp:Transcript_1951/g.4203  ORF Transcript_1951/g.4203 Transcript_1951/m.4203 type:complete len:331 (+) Transcript_1951:62-1054(+)